MDKNLAGLIGAMGALAVGAPQAATAAPLDLETALQASSYADLLKPIPNALALWKSTAVVDAQPAEVGDARVETVQYHDHHHHHHHHHYRRRHRHFFSVRPVPPVVVDHHHHHHHHHHAAVVVVPPRS
jgi:hypothetical protein